MHDLRVTDGAGGDLDNIWRYTDDRYGREAANTYLRGFNTVFDLLRERPHAGAIVAGVRPATRSFGHREHRLYYRIEDDTIVIVGIIHKARNAAVFFG